jgi:Super-infection exclusion protein B
MSDPSGGWVRDVLDFIKSSSSIKVTIAVFLVSGFCLAFPFTSREQIGIAMWVYTWRPWLFVACLFSGVISVLTAAQYFGAPVLSKRRTKRRIERYCETLSIDEIPILLQYSDGKKTYWFYPNDGAVQHLVQQGILYCTSNARYPGEVCGYTITNDAEPYVRKILKDLKTPPLRGTL